MAVTESDLVLGGRVYLRTRFIVHQTQQPKRRHAEVLRVARNCATIRTLDDGDERTVRFNELDPDDEWLADYDQKRLNRRRLQDMGIATEEYVSPVPSLSVPILAYTEAKSQQRRGRDRARERAREEERASVIVATAPEATSPEPISEVISVPAPVKTVPATAPGVPDFEGWLQAGAQLLDPLKEELQQLDDRELELAEEIEQLKRRRNVLKPKLEAIELVLRAGS